MFSNNGQGQTSTSATSTGTVLFNFSQGVGQWKGTNVIGGPWQSKEFVVQSTDSLKIDITLTQGGRYALYSQQQPSIQLGGRKRLTARARVASWGFANNGIMNAKLYIKVGPAWTWYDSGSVQLNSNTATALVLDLTRIPSSGLNDVREIGIEYSSSANGGPTSAYLSYITME